MGERRFLLVDSSALPDACSLKVQAGQGASGFRQREQYFHGSAPSGGYFCKCVL